LQIKERELSGLVEQFFCCYRQTVPIKVPQPSGHFHQNQKPKEDLVRTYGVFISILLAGVSLLACQPPSPNAAPASALPSDKPVSLAEDANLLAQRLITESAGVKEGDIVQIIGGFHDKELLENLAVQVRKAGAFPLLTVTSDSMARRLFTDVPEKYDSQTPELRLKLAGTVNVTIEIDSRLTEDVLADVDPKRVIAQGVVTSAVQTESLKRKVRSVAVGNDLYPTPWRAKHLDMTEDQLSKAFWDGVNVDYSALQAKGEQVRKTLAGGSELHITNPNGTDLKVSIKGRPISVSDGVISADDLKAGGPNTQVWLPAGEVYGMPVAGTAEGKVVQERSYFEGKEIQGLTLTFVKGKLTSMTGSGPGFDVLKARYDSAGEGRDTFAFFDFGINPNVKLPAGNKVGTWVPAGMISVGFGADVWVGGTNAVSFNYASFLPGSSVTLDGRPIIANGQMENLN
jgi:leucyl aminopeptidase (aminopeptidase T)